MEVHSTAQDSVITLFMSSITCSAGCEQIKKKPTMKIDAVYLWLYNVATLISVWNKHCAFKKGSHSYFPTSACQAANMESMLTLGYCDPDTRWSAESFFDKTRLRRYASVMKILMQKCSLVTKVQKTKEFKLKTSCRSNILLSTGSV